MFINKTDGFVPELIEGRITWQRYNRAINNAMHHLTMYTRKN